MIIEVDGKNFSSAQIKAGNFESNGLSPDSIHLLSFISNWVNQTKQFSFHSSGSSGKPKKIVLSREVIEYSARQTLKYLELENGDSKKMLLCLSPKVIGGAMLIVRALICQADLAVIPANSNFDRLNEKFDLVSLAPIQVKKIASTNPGIFNQFKNVLIGGAALDPSLEKSLQRYSSNFYHTYGMTETASHVAIRKMLDDQYYTLGDIQIDTNEGQLRLKGTVTSNEWLETNDLVELTSAQSFRWLGRADTIINSGGIKVDPEKLESLLANQIREPFAISSLPDSELGEKITLVSESSETVLSLEEIPRYHRPKTFIWNHRIPRTDSGKIARNELKELISNVKS